MNYENTQKQERKPEHKNRTEQEERLEKGPRLMLERLGPELFQCETSALQHARREAERLEDTPPAHALRAVADHAGEALHSLQALATARGMAPSRIGGMVGAMFATIRNQMVGRVIDEERSYRATLLGLRHGVDVVRMTRFVAFELDDTELVQWCDCWLEVRTSLIDEIDEHMAWFATHPARALQPARSLRHN